MGGAGLVGVRELGRGWGGKFWGWGGEIDGLLFQMGKNGDGGLGELGKDSRKICLSIVFGVAL